MKTLSLLMLISIGCSVVGQDSPPSSPRQKEDNKKGPSPTEQAIAKLCLDTPMEDPPRSNVEQPARRFLQLAPIDPLNPYGF